MKLPERKRPKKIKDFKRSLKLIQKWNQVLNEASQGLQKECSELLVGNPDYLKEVEGLKTTDDAYKDAFQKFLLSNTEFLAKATELSKIESEVKEIFLLDNFGELLDMVFEDSEITEDTPLPDEETEGFMEFLVKVWDDFLAVSQKFGKNATA
jgi:hypothetical protein